jgi:predicted nuclease of predicted toxin-antitoxin system
LINGRGYRIRRARDVALEAEDDQAIVEYCLAWQLVLVTFDADLRDKALRGQCQVLHVRTPERTARDRLAQRMDDVAARLLRGHSLVTLLRDGRVDPPA